VSGKHRPNPVLGQSASTHIRTLLAATGGSALFRQRHDIALLVSRIRDKETDVILDVGMVGARVASKTRLAPTRRAPSRPSLRFGAALAAVGGLAACTPATAPGASRDVAARPAYVQLPASF